MTQHTAREQSQLRENRQWKHYVKLSKAKTLSELETLNAAINRHVYVTDVKNWDREDHWASPMQFLAKGGGDCEDFAIMKYKALREAGWRSSELRIAILMDKKIQQPHAVLLVRLAGVDYVLDNQSNEILPATSIAHYSPVYAINEHSWWKYQPSITPEAVDDFATATQ